jgi:hypothetical protein
MRGELKCPFCPHTAHDSRSWRRHWIADHMIKTHWDQLIQLVGQLNPKYLKRKLTELQNDKGQGFTVDWPEPDKVPKECTEKMAELSNNTYKLAVKLDIAYWYMNYLGI